MEAYMANLKLTSKENSIERLLQVKFASSLLDLASFIYVSMVKKENQKDYSFLLRADDTVYITKKDEEDSGYYYSDGTYRLLDNERFINIVLRRPNKLTFEIIYIPRQENLVYDIDVSDIALATGEKDIVFLDGKGILAGELIEESVSLSSISEQLEKKFKNRKRI